MGPDNNQCLHCGREGPSPRKQNVEVYSKRVAPIWHKNIQRSGEYWIVAIRINGVEFKTEVRTCEEAQALVLKTVKDLNLDILL